MNTGNSDDLKRALNRLTGIMQQFDRNAANEKHQLLHHLSNGTFQPPDLISYHHCLLFLTAYPQTATLNKMAQQELKRIAGLAQSVYLGKSDAKRNRLTNTGISGTAMHVSFSFDLVKWLSEKFPDQVSIFSCDADEETIKSVFLAGLHRFEADRFREDSFTLQQLIRKLKPKSAGSDLHWLLQFLDHIPVSHEIRSHLYDSLKLFITISLTGPVPSLTSARSVPRKTFFHKTELIRRFDPDSELREKKAAPYKLAARDKEHIIEAARMTLCALLRETDPVTHANVNEVELFDMGRGIDIALYPMIHEKKLSLESYIGYMAFKNRVPIAYGGGWIFLHRSKIGINIFPALRGGESSYLFAQILRIYHLHYRVKKFIVEPYQIGKNNAEGLRSGAYWFYYRLGFRSDKKELQKTADHEFMLLKQNRNYRPPLHIMKQLSGSNMELNLAPGENYPDESPEPVSELLTRYINEHHAGKRTESLKMDFMKLKEGKSERESILKLQRDSRLLEELKQRLLVPGRSIRRM